MSTKIKNGNSAAKMTGVIRSEQLYNKLAFDADKKGYLKLTEKQRKQLNYLSRFGFVELPQSGSSYTVITDSAKQTMKVKLISPGLPHSPLKESNMASTRALEAMNTLLLMKGIQRMRTGSDKLNADFLTLTFQNVRFGELKDSLDDLKKGYRQLKDWLRKTYSFSKLHLLGAMPRFEITVNKESLEKHSSFNLYHPHVHAILFFDTETNDRRLTEDLYAKWAELCKKMGHETNKQAFKIEHAYVKGVDGRKIVSSGDAAISEAVKYVVKPAEINRLGKVDEEGSFDNFYLKVFAEIYRTFVRRSSDGRQLKFRVDPSGLVKEARSYLNAFKKAGLGGLFGMQFSDGDLVRVPSIFSQISTLVVRGIKESSRVKSGFKFYSEYTKTQSFSAAEMLYYNSALIANTVFKDFDLEKIKRLVFNIAKVSSVEELNKRQKTMFWLLKNWLNITTDVEQVNSVFEDWLGTCEKNIGSSDGSKLAALKFSDVEKLKDAFNWAIDNPSEYQDSRVRDFGEDSKAELVQKIAKNHNLSRKDIDNLAVGFIARDDDKLWGFLSDYTYALTGKGVVDDGNGINGKKFWTNNSFISPVLEFSKIVAYLDSYSNGFDLLAHAFSSDYLLQEGYEELGSENRHISFECVGCNFRFAKCIAGLKATRQEKCQTDLKQIVA